MKSIYKITALSAGLLFAVAAQAYRYVGSGNSGMSTQNNDEPVATRAAACAPATALLDLEWNNVRARIETGGNMWQNRANGTSAYEVPKTETGAGGVSSIYAGGLWMGGKSQDQTLKLAAVRFRQNGNDFWPGPLSTGGTAEVTAQTCLDYDKFAVTLREDAVRHRIYWDMVTEGASAEEIAEIFPDGYAMPSYFNSFPAHGNTAAGQDYYLGPFKDYNNNGLYDPEYGDYPWYDFLREIDCATRRREDQIPLFGDQTYFWIFNDKGNVHTESQGLPIGMEVRAQAFAFTTNDEVNNMTFLNYVLINQGSQTLTETYFGSWVDPDLGFANDDYVGCDVQRGLGYCYNGDSFDEAGTGSLGYGQNPPAVGVDFFEGPYQDEDGQANPLTQDIILAEEQLGIPYSGLGIGYGDTIVDNERFGMRRFVYYNNSSNPINGEPASPQHYYNYMRGIWKNGQEMLFGGNGVSGAGVVSGVPAQYMFPSDTDPYNWSTYGVVPPSTSVPWSELNAQGSTGNAPADRRFIQAAGPFTLQPGDYNNITLGVVWARAVSGGPEESVELLRLADDKAQSLFDNCFELVNGPDAPDVTVRELDGELILMLTNNNPASNNYQEQYSEFDPSIPEQLQDGTNLTLEERSYRFEGYLIYQLKDDQVSNADLGDVNKARLIAQFDIQNDVIEIINYNRDQTTGLITPSLMVQGANEGVQHSLRVTTDAFALGAPQLVNHKTYYFMAVAYGYNKYQEYDFATSTGQDEVYKASRKSAIGQIPRVAAIPHKTSMENGGTIINAGYGTGVPITRIEGTGNGKNILNLSAETENEILNEPYYAERASYLPGGGPVQVKVIDPLRVPAGEFELSLSDAVGDFDAADMRWKLANITTGQVDSSFNAFSAINEDLLLDYGLSLTWGQYVYFNEDGGLAKHKVDFLDGDIEFADPLNPWLTGIPDEDGFSELNWIRAGTVETTTVDAPETETIYDDYKNGSDSEPYTDASEAYEKVLGGTWSPYCLVAYSDEITVSDGPPAVNEWYNTTSPTIPSLKGDISPPTFSNISNLKGLNNIDVVFTSDKSKWTRCPVLEMQPILEIAKDDFNGAYGDPDKMHCRRHKSVDKNGRTSDDAGYNAEEGDLVSPWGMGWFPGYVIDVGTGERLNVAFGEDSWLVGENGNDMLFNPSNRLFGSSGQPLFGGQHWIYVFKNIRAEMFEEYDEGDPALGADTTYCPGYDQGRFLFSRLGSATLSPTNLKKVYRACTWVGSSLSTFTSFGQINANGSAMLSPEEGLIPNTCRIRLRVAKPYAKANPSGGAQDAPESLNEWRNLYYFSTKDLAATTNNSSVLTSELDNINIVPNPYYAFSSYETSKLDNRVKITNLPAVCTISIYDLNGTRIRQFKKGDPTTYLDWDLKNDQNIPIASGVYIIHIDVPNIGEKVLKWFGVMRPIDLDNF
jgi:hypothetical protein